MIAPAPLNLASDNVTGACPQVLEELIEANAGPAAPYGGDPWTRGLEASLRALFERDLVVLPVPTGTGANGLALACLTPGWGACLAHPASHVMSRESGAPEHYTGGAKLIGVDGADGLIDPAALDDALVPRPPGGVHAPNLRSLSVSQLSDLGTVYGLDHLGALCERARAAGLRVHMDGARFANAVAALGCTPAEASWKAGVDVLSLGGTKNGAWMAEAVVLFDPTLTEAAPFLRKRGGLLVSKQRFVSAQLLALYGDGTWLALAQAANRRAGELADAVLAAGLALAHPRDANMIYVHLSPQRCERLAAHGVVFHHWAGATGHVARFVAAWNTPADAADRLARALAVSASGVEP